MLNVIHAPVQCRRTRRLPPARWRSRPSACTRLTSASIARSPNVLVRAWPLRIVAGCSALRLRRLPGWFLALGHWLTCGPLRIWTVSAPGDSVGVNRTGPPTLMKSYETIRIETPREHTVLVTLNRPEVLNAMNTQMGIDLLDAFDGFCAAPNR